MAGWQAGSAGWEQSDKAGREASQAEANKAGWPNRLARGRDVGTREGSQGALQSCGTQWDCGRDLRDLRD